MSWTYRIVKEKVKGGFKYSIKEVYDNPDRVTKESIAAEEYSDKINKYTEQQCIDSIRTQLVRMLLDTTRPIYEVKKNVSNPT